MERLPFRRRRAGDLRRDRRAAGAVLLDNVRNMYNTGSFFRTADAAGLEKLYLCGITGRPTKKAIDFEDGSGGGADGAVGARVGTTARDHTIRAPGYQVAAVETACMRWTCSTGSRVSRYAWCSATEVDGRPEISALCDTQVRIPMLGTNTR